MKKIREIKPGAKKQIMGGLVYMALAVTVVAVTIGTVVGTFSDDEVTTEKNKNSGEDTIYNGNYILKAPENKVENNLKTEDFSLDTPVSDNPSGINAEIVLPGYEKTEDLQTEAISEDTPDTLIEQVYEPQESEDKTKPVSEEPDEPVFEYGYDGFIKPCAGYISKEFSMDVPVYSVSMYDYRTHNGVDIVSEVGTPVKASSNGVITDIYDDYLYGTTVVIEHKDGLKSVYSNLSPDLPADTVEGRTVITGEIIGGIGESAVCEAADAKHLHFEMMQDGVYVDPTEYLVN